MPFAYLQWWFHSGEQVVAPGPPVKLCERVDNELLLNGIETQDSGSNSSIYLSNF